MSSEQAKALFAQSQILLSKQIEITQSQALYLAKQLELNLKDALVDGLPSLSRNFRAKLSKMKETLVEGLSVPARGVSFAIKNMGEFTELLGESLVVITSVSKMLSEASAYLVQANIKRAQANHYVISTLCPHLQHAAQKLESLGGRIMEFSQHLATGNFKNCVTAFGETVKTLGNAANGMQQLFLLSAKIDATIMAPATEQLAHASQKFFWALHSVAESIREFCQGVHFRCKDLAKQVNIKPDSAANKKLDAIASTVASKASNLVWSFLANPQKTITLEAKATDPSPSPTGPKRNPSH